MVIVRRASSIPQWHEAVDLVRAHVLRIMTPSASGTGFFLGRSAKAGLCAIATANHVVSEPEEWEQPIKIKHDAAADALLLRASDRVIISNNADASVIIFKDSEELKLPAKPLELIEEGKVKKQGLEIGWVGFPYVSTSLCFFSGRISGRRDNNKTYLVDGVAINGVSGGPAFACRRGGIEIVGVVSAYISNRATGETLPGLSVVRDVTHFRQTVKKLTSMDDATQKKKEEAEVEGKNA